MVTRNTEAVNRRADQHDNPTPAPVVVVNPIQAEIVNHPNHPVPVKESEKL